MRLVTKNHVTVKNRKSDNLKKEMNPEKNSLSHSKQARFTIPNISELA